MLRVIWSMPERLPSCRWRLPIGTNKGLATREFIQILIDEIDLPIIVDAGIGTPVAGLRGHGDGRGSYHGQHRDVPPQAICRLMAEAFKQAIEAGRNGIPVPVWAVSVSTAVGILSADRISCRIKRREHDGK